MNVNDIKIEDNTDSEAKNVQKSQEDNKNDLLLKIAFPSLSVKRITS